MHGEAGRPINDGDRCPASVLHSAVVMAIPAASSRQLLAASIERVLRGEMPTRGSPAELATSIDALLLRVVAHSGV